MKFKNFVVLGNTIDKDKYAYKIKENLITNGYLVASVSKELPSINDVPFDIDVLDLCIHPIKGISYLKESLKNYKVVLIQPGASSDEIKEFLESKKIPYIEGCALVGLKVIGKSVI